MISFSTRPFLALVSLQLIYSISFPYTSRFRHLASPSTHLMFFRPYFPDPSPCASVTLPFHLTPSLLNPHIAHPPLAFDSTRPLNCFSFLSTPMMFLYFPLWPGSLLSDTQRPLRVSTLHHPSHNVHHSLILSHRISSAIVSLQT